MSDRNFRALLVEDGGDGSFLRRVVERHVDELPAGDVLVRVRYSSLNYKDALSASGNRGVTRRYPHTPGIEAAGVIAESSDPRFSPGQEVLACCYDLGMNTAGGFGQFIRVPACLGDGEAGRLVAQRVHDRRHRRFYRGPVRGRHPANIRFRRRTEKFWLPAPPAG